VSAASPTHSHTASRLVYFIDDMNMPFVDKYDTQSAIELVRQMVDYRGW
jgi:dynein heavy chain